MWIFLNDAFVSIVRDQRDADRLMVRARKPGDLERLFPDCLVIETPANDYRYRTSLPREVVAAAVSGRLLGIDYGNFKGSIAKDAPGRERHDAYLEAWSAMKRYQDRGSGPRKLDRDDWNRRGLFGDLHDPGPATGEAPAKARAADRRRRTRG